MDDLISREQTHELLSERMRDTALYNACEDAGTILIDIVQNRLERWLNELPSAEPVIRYDGYCCRLSSRTQDDYCSHSKRRTDE